MAGNVTHVSDKLIKSTDVAPDHPSTNVVPSPPSGNSSDTLHDDESSDDNRKIPNISPFTIATINFGDLKIHEDDLSYPQKDLDHFPGSSYSNVRYHNRPAPAYSHPIQQLRRNNHHMGSGNGFYGRGSHLNTRTWVSEEARAAQEFLVVRNSMKRLFKNADVAKWKVTDYIAHREALMASAAKKLLRKVQDKEDEAVLRVPPISPQQQDMMRRCGLKGNFDQTGNHGRILGEKTIWCEDWQNGKDEIAPWPCLAELKWEGDDRAKTGVGRYPPLPREQGPVGLPWNQLQAVEQYPLDQIACIPTMEDVYLPVDEIGEEVKYSLLNKNLEDAMDAYLES
ncbi:uncharacterized protein EKO05_0006462 [Ascochyta rabiei]|uniref:uncharacterized protein n=1 Tax=Didymella rabiei TaxID=5454 RepID=UPI0018FFF522|nr:uncharacterized protein EKO05_0006462 [Ascochyta rabiei]UPX16037.1 hypothetical protein EKO05_0006462 [Ascochyta rabiei]